MKLLILSDLHIEFEPFEPASTLEFDVVILAGDIHSPSRRAVEWAEARFAGKPVIYVPGNHEYRDSRMDLAQSEARAAATGGRAHLLEAARSQSTVCASSVARFGRTLSWRSKYPKVDDEMRGWP